MKYSEFKKAVENKLLYVEKGHFNNITVTNQVGKTVAFVSGTIEDSVSLDWTAYDSLPKKTRRFLAQKCMELAFTSLEDREEDTKYYYKLRGFSADEPCYLRKYRATNEYFIGSKIVSVTSIAQFTELEFKKLPTYIRLHNWEKISVEDGVVVNA